MTDKQIIIDGTHCRYAHFDGGNTQRLLCAIDDCFCDGLRTNECYYKQLKRKEQECERLKEQLADMISQSALLPKFFGLTADEITQLATKCSQLKQTFTEIKEIAETQRRYIDDIKGFMFDDKLVEWKSAYIDFSTACRRLNQEILQKISEEEE